MLCKRRGLAAQVIDLLILSVRLSRWKLMDCMGVTGAQKAFWYLNIYAAISGVQICLEFFRGFLAKYLALKAARYLHTSMLGALLRCGAAHCW